MPKVVQSRKGLKLKNLPVSEKLKLLDDVDAGHSMLVLCEKYDIKKRTFYDIRRDKAKLRSYAAARDGDDGKKKNLVKRIKALKYEELDAAVYKWYKQERLVKN